MSVVSEQLDFNIRGMQLADLDAVLTIEEQLFAAPWSMISYRFEMSNPMSQKWVVEVDETGAKRIIGLIVVWMLVDKAYIANIAVAREYQRQGIGCKLLMYALETCTRMGAKSAALEVRASNQVALAMYTRFGFEQAGRRVGYYQDNNEDALLFTINNLNSEHLSEIICQ